MMLFKLSIQNIKKSFKDYAIYFFTLILGVAIFYIFNSLESQTVLLNVSSSTQEIIKLMMNILSAVSVFIAFILGFLIIYASRFLMKRRHREFGIYMTLGMGKGDISKILLFETLLIGILSLFVGLGVGVFLSQAMSVFVANMFEADLTKFTFVFSSSAMIKTILYFGVMYVCVMIFNTISVGKCKLIDLIQASKKSEQVRMKNLVLCILVFLIGACALGYAYYKVTAGVETIQKANEIFVPVILGVVSTFLIIWSLSGVLLRILQHSKKYYYRHLNSFTVRQISSKINTTVVSMSFITLMLFFTICVLSSALSMKNSMTANLTELAPADIQIVKTMDLEKRYNVVGTPYDSFISDEDRIDTKLRIRETLQRADFSVEENFVDVQDFFVYQVPDVRMKTTLGNVYPEIAQKHPFMNLDLLEGFVKLSDYNELAKFYNLPTYDLEQNEYVLVADYSSVVEIRNKGLEQNTAIEILGKRYYPKYQSCQNGFLEMSSNHINTGFFVVPDDALIEDYRYQNVLVANYRGSSSDEKKLIESRFAEVENHPYIKSLYQSRIDATTKLVIYESSVGLGAMVTFIALYLGVIFLISSAALLALKELSESTDNKIRYQMLRKIGTDEKMIYQALFRQIAIFFLFPLLFAIIHSIFGIQFCNYILETFGDAQLLKSILMTAVILVFIYGGYFLITYYCSKNIIKEKTRY